MFVHQFDRFVEYKTIISLLSRDLFIKCELSFIQYKGYLVNYLILTMFNILLMI